MFMRRSQASSGTDAMGPRARRMAPLTRVSMRPNLATVASTMAWTWSGWVTSQICTRASRPWARTCSAVIAASLSLMSTMTTSAPSSAKITAKARPIPVAAPVMMATLSSSPPRTGRCSLTPILLSDLAALTMSFENRLECAARGDRVADDLDAVAELADQRLERVLRQAGGRGHDPVGVELHQVLGVVQVV